MNRADLSLVLNQVDNVGDTLLQNRMLKQRKEERAEDMTLRRDELAAQTQHRTDQVENNRLANTFRQLSKHSEMIKGDIEMLAEQARSRASAGEDGDSWAAQQFQAALDSAPPEFSAQLKTQFKTVLSPGFKWTAVGAPKEPGQMETSQTRNHAELKKLQEQIRQATTPEAKAQAEQDLAEFRGLLPGRPDVAQPKPAPTLDDEALKSARSKRAEAVAGGNAVEVKRIDTLMDKLTGKNFRPVMGDVRQRDEQLMAAEDAATGALPLPKAKSALVAGKRYQTTRGPATWNGTAFEQ